MTGEPVDLLGVTWRSAVVGDRVDGALIAYIETWDRKSITIPDKPVPLRLFHDQKKPIGVLDRFDVTAEGLRVRGRLAGSTMHRENLRELVRARLAGDVSIGFSGDPRTDRWAPPSKRGGLASLLRRGVRPVECSLVGDAALPGSRVLSIADPDPAPPREVYHPVGAGSGVTATAVLAEALAALQGAPGSFARRRWEAASAERNGASLESIRQEVLAGPRDFVGMPLTELFAETKRLQAVVERRGGEDRLTSFQRAELDNLDTEWRRRRRNPDAEAWLLSMLQIEREVEARRVTRAGA